MNNYLTRLIERHTGAMQPIQARLPSQFEPAAGDLTATDAEVPVNSGQAITGRQPAPTHQPAPRNDEIENRQNRKNNRDRSVSADVKPAHDMADKPRPDLTHPAEAEKMREDRPETLSVPTGESLKPPVKAIPDRVEAESGAFTPSVSLPAKERPESRIVTPRPTVSAGGDEPASIEDESEFLPALPDFEFSPPVVRDTPPDSIREHLPDARISPDITITIDTIDVRAIVTETAPPRKSTARRREPKLSLENYLKSRSGG